MLGWTLLRQERCLLWFIIDSFHSPLVTAGWGPHLLWSYKGEMLITQTPPWFTERERSLRLLNVAMIILQNATWIITHLCVISKWNKYVSDSSGAKLSCLYCFSRPWRHWHALYIVLHIANWSHSSQSRGLGAKTIQAVCIHNTVSCDRTTISTWHLENRKKGSAGTQMCWRVLKEERGENYLTPCRGRSRLHSTEGRGLHHVLLRGEYVTSSWSDGKICVGL